jgi:cellulose biosynthesis protein BcsQ
VLTVFGTGKGGTGKSTSCLEIGSILSKTNSVAILSLDTNAALHNRFVRMGDRQPETHAATLRIDPDARCWPRARRLNAMLNADDPRVDIEGQYMYRRPDVDNLGVLFIDPGSLNTLATAMNDIGKRKRMSALLRYLTDNYDHVLVDPPADLESPLIGMAVLEADLIVPVTTLAQEEFIGMRSTFQDAVHWQVPVDGFIITPYHRRADRDARAVQVMCSAFAMKHNLAMHKVQQDSHLKGAQDARTPLVNYFPAALARKTMPHPFETDPPAALADFAKVAAWLEELRQDPAGLQARWSARCAAVTSRAASTPAHAPLAN